MGGGSAQGARRQKILEVATELIQRHGYNAFSYADIARALNITKASLHYHFPTKAELGTCLIQRYEDLFLAALAEIDRSCSYASDKLKRYVQLYDNVLKDDRLCLCGMLAAETATLPKSMNDELRHFFDANENWLAEVLTEGQNNDDLRLNGSARHVAMYLIGSLEGAMMIARAYKDFERFQLAAETALSVLRVKAV
jgi:TetR/AcrR family transcriptional repressor of nem operon